MLLRLLVRLDAARTRRAALREVFGERLGKEVWERRVLEVGCTARADELDVDDAPASSEKGGDVLGMNRRNEL